MAVPGSGTLTLLGIAQERYYSTYGTGTITGPIVYTDLINGGNTGGSGMNYPALNTSSASLPTTSTPWPMDEWYSYDQSASSSCTAVTLKYNATVAKDACISKRPITLYTDYPTGIFTHPLYTNSGCTTSAATGYYTTGVSGSAVCLYNSSTQTWGSICGSCK